jgi:hypothetical protein
MEKEDIISGSKLIAEYMNLVYLPFSAELKEKGMKAGWYQTISAEHRIEKTKVTTFENGIKIKEEELNINMNLLRYNNKNGWKLFEGSYYKYVCRHHGDLRYWNSLDELVPVIQKIEKEFKVSFYLGDNGCFCGNNSWGDLRSISSYDLPNWNQNVFSVVVSFLQVKSLSETHKK